MKNNRTFLEKLLDGAEVEWKPLNKIVTTITAPVKLKREMYCSTGSTPIIDQGEKFIAGYTDENFEAIPSNEYIIFGDHSEHIKYVNFSFIQGADGLKILKPKEDNAKYIYYAFQNFYVKELNYKRHWSSAKETLIPIPPPTVQTEIVKILDALTALTSELTSELTLRRKQYEYYREKLLSVDNLKLSTENIQWVKLNDLGELIRGNGLQKKDFTETGVPAIHYGQIYTYYGTFATKTKSFVSPELAKKLKKVDCGDVVITNTSENFEDVGKAMVYLGKEQAVTGGHATIFKPNHEKILSKYFVYLTQTSFFTNEKRKYAKGTKVIDVSATDMAKIILPIPPLKEQQRIVSILDKFETLSNSITEGLPLSIEQSQKRYEYYRELLLSF